jgi:hypothetical protein
MVGFAMMRGPVEVNRIEVLGNQSVGETFAFRFAAGM